MQMILTLLKTYLLSFIGICFIVVPASGRPIPIQRIVDNIFEANATTSIEYNTLFTSNPYYTSRAVVNTPRSYDYALNDYTTDVLRSEYLDPYKQDKIYSKTLFDYNDFKIQNYATQPSDLAKFLNFLKTSTEPNTGELLDYKEFNTLQLEAFLDIIKKKAKEKFYLQQPLEGKGTYKKRSATKVCNKTEEKPNKTSGLKRMYNKMFRNKSSKKKTTKKANDCKTETHKTTAAKQVTKKKKNKCAKCQGDIRRSTIPITTTSVELEDTTKKDFKEEGSTEIVTRENDQTTDNTAPKEDDDNDAPKSRTTDNSDSISQNLTLLAVPHQNIIKKKHKLSKPHITNKKHQRQIVNSLKYLTSPTERFFYKRQIPEEGYENTIKITPKQDVTLTNDTKIAEVDTENNEVLESPVMNAYFNNATTEPIDLGSLTQKLSYTDYINGYKYYLNYQRELGKEKFSDLVKYQAHRHHNVDDIGKFILEKLPPIPNINRDKRRFFDDDSMDDQDLSTRGDDTWFKKHFYLFLNTSPPNKVQSESTQSKQTKTQPVAKPYIDNSYSAFDILNDRNKRDSQSDGHTSAFFGSDTSYLKDLVTETTTTRKPSLMDYIRKYIEIKELTSTTASYSFTTDTSKSDIMNQRVKRHNRFMQSRDSKKNNVPIIHKKGEICQNKRKPKHKGFFRKIDHHKTIDGHKLSKHDHALRRNCRFIGFKNLKNLLRDNKLHNAVLSKPTYMDYLMRSNNATKVTNEKCARTKPHKYNIPNPNDLKAQVPNITGMAHNEEYSKALPGPEKFSMEDKSLQNTNSPAQYPAFPNQNPQYPEQNSSFPALESHSNSILENGPSAGLNLPTLKTEPDTFTFDETYSKDFALTEDFASTSSEELWSMGKTPTDIFQFNEQPTTIGTYQNIELDNLTHSNSFEGLGGIEDSMNLYNISLPSIQSETMLFTKSSLEFDFETNSKPNVESSYNLGAENMNDAMDNEMIHFDKLLATSMGPRKQARTTKNYMKYRMTIPNDFLTTESRIMGRIENKRSSSKGYVFFDSTLLAYDDGVDLITETLGLSEPKQRQLSGHHRVMNSRNEVHSTPPKQFYTTPVPMKVNEFNKFLKDNDLEVTPLTNSIFKYSLASDSYAKLHERLSANPTKIIKMDKKLFHFRNNKDEYGNVFKRNNSSEFVEADNAKSHKSTNQYYESNKRSSPYDFFESKAKYTHPRHAGPRFNKKGFKIVNYPEKDQFLVYSTQKIAIKDEFDNSPDIDLTVIPETVFDATELPKIENTLTDDLSVQTTVSDASRLKNLLKDLPDLSGKEISPTTPIVSLTKRYINHAQPKRAQMRNNDNKFDIVLNDARAAHASTDVNHIFRDRIKNRKQKRWKRKSKRRRKRFGTELFKFWGKPSKETLANTTISLKASTPTTPIVNTQDKPAVKIANAADTEDKSIITDAFADNTTMFLLESPDPNTFPASVVNDMIRSSTKSIMDKMYGTKNSSSTKGVTFPKMMATAIDVEQDINSDEIENMEKQLNEKSSFLRTDVPKLSEKFVTEKATAKSISHKNMITPKKQEMLKDKTPKSHIVKRTASATAFTANDVSELELVVEVEKKSELDSDNNKKRDLHLILNSLSESKPIKKEASLEPLHLSSTKVYIVVTDSPTTAVSLSLNEPVKQRKVFSAIMSTPVDILYQIHAYDNITVDSEPYFSILSTPSATEISNGIYLIIQKGGKIILNPVRELTDSLKTQPTTTPGTSDTMKGAKDIIYAVEEKLNKIYDIIMSNNRNHIVKVRGASYYTLPTVTAPMRPRKDNEYIISSTMSYNDNEITRQVNELISTDDDFLGMTKPKNYNINVIGTVVKVPDRTKQSTLNKEMQIFSSTTDSKIMEVSPEKSKRVSEKHKIINTPYFGRRPLSNSRSQNIKENTESEMYNGFTPSNNFSSSSILIKSSTAELEKDLMQNRLESIMDKLKFVTSDIFEHSLDINDAILNLGAKMRKEKVVSPSTPYKQLNITNPSSSYDTPSYSASTTLFSTLDNITNKKEMLNNVFSLSTTGIATTKQTTNRILNKGKIKNLVNALLTYNKDKSKEPLSTTTKVLKTTTTSKKPVNQTKKQQRIEKSKSIQRVGPDKKQKLVTKSKMKISSGNFSNITTTTLSVADNKKKTTTGSTKLGTITATATVTIAVSNATEAPQAVPGNLNMVCDLPATFQNIELLHEKVPRQEFANIIKHMNCLTYKEPPKFFLLTCKKKKNLNVNKPKTFMRRLRWDWIREKRSLYSNVSDGDNSDYSNANDYSSGQFNLFKVYLVQDSDYFEEFVKDSHGIYRGKRNDRRKRKSTNEDKTDELYIYSGDTVIIDCMTMPGISKPGINNDITLMWETEDKELTETDNSGVLGTLLVIEDTHPRNDGIYLCKDVIALKKFESDMETYVCPSKKQCNITIHKPFCFTDRLSNVSHLKAMIVVTLRPPILACNTECKRDLYSGLCNLTIANIPLILKTPLILSSNGGNITLKPVPKEDISGGVAHALIREVEPANNAYLNFAVKMHPGDIQTIYTCSAGYFLIPQEKICASCPRNTSSNAGQNICVACPMGSWAPPGAATCVRAARDTSRCHWWFDPSLTVHYMLTSLMVTAGCACCVAAVSRRRHGDPRANAIRRDLEKGTRKTIAPVEHNIRLSQLCRSTSGYRNRSKPLSPSRVILARLFSSPPRSRDDSQNKFEIWKEQNSRPPVPPVDFDY